MDLINLELYRVFYVVARVGNLSRAAEILYTGQPSVSKAIRRLEDAFETPLFTRSSRGVTLTESGELLFRHVSRALSELNEGELLLKKRNHATQAQLSIGISPMLYKYYVSPHLKAFLDAHPNLKINIVDHSMSYKVIEAVRQGALDLGVVSRPTEAGDLTFLPIASIQELFIAEPGYLAKLHYTDIPSFFGQATLIFLEKGNVAREYNERYLQGIGVQAVPEITTSNMDFIIELVASGIGVGIVYETAVRDALRDGRLKALPFLPPIPPREIGIVLKKGCLPTFAVDAFVAHYRSAFLAQHAEKGR